MSLGPVIVLQAAASVHQKEAIGRVSELQELRTTTQIVEAVHKSVANEESARAAAMNAMSQPGETCQPGETMQSHSEVHQDCAPAKVDQRHEPEQQLDASVPVADIDASNQEQQALVHTKKGRGRERSSPFGTKKLYWGPVDLFGQKKTTISMTFGLW